MKKPSNKELKKKFKKIYKEEFDDCNESFMDFMLDLISKQKLMETLKKGNRYYYHIIRRYL